MIFLTLSFASVANMGSPERRPGDVEEKTSCLPVRRASSSSPQFVLPKLQFPQFPGIPSLSMSSPILRSNSPRNAHGAGGTSEAAPGSADAPSLGRRGKRSSRVSPSRSPQLGQSPMSPPNELLVLVHGLQGAVEDFTFFHQQLLHSAPGVDGSLLVHVTDVNTDKTHDGVDEGGLRLAEDVRAVVSENPSLTCISFVGFSLGGLYARFAIGELFNCESRTVCGLVPNSFVTVASPNLGVRSFGVYRFIPDPLISASKFFLGRTGEHLVLKDCNVNPLVLEMSSDDNTLEIPFLSALRSFSKRVLYGNMQQDFMVNWGTSVLDARVHGISGQDVHESIAEHARAAGSSTVDSSFDSKGCKVAFTYSYPQRDVSSSGLESTGGPSTELNGSASPSDSGSETSVELLMAQRLQSVGWDVVAIDFPLPIPIAHNRIMAMSRGPIHTWMNAPGRRAVRHLVDTLVADYDGHEKLFERMVEPEAEENPEEGVALPR